MEIRGAKKRFAFAAHLIAVAGKISRIKAPDQTQREWAYLTELMDAHSPIRLRLADNDEVEGVIESCDAGFIRLKQEDNPSLFILKREIKYLYKLPLSGSSTQ